MCIIGQDFFHIVFMKTIEIFSRQLKKDLTILMQWNHSETKIFMGALAPMAP